jgi:hypothetical protein
VNCGYASVSTLSESDLTLLPFSRLSPPPRRTVLDHMKAHPTFSAFLDPDFDPTAFASKVVIADANDPPQGGKSRSASEGCLSWSLWRVLYVKHIS